MKRRLMDTNDGSKTIYIEELDETYHSFHGAIQEANHVFIKNGLQAFENTAISIFEMGFGTGLNALITWMNCEKLNLSVHYTGIEAYPVEAELLEELNYTIELKEDASIKFESMHNALWDKTISLDKRFSLHKMNMKIEDFQPEMGSTDLIYFDAFGPNAQADMWDFAILLKMHQLLKIGGVFVTYCAKGQVKRDLKTLGFEVQSLDGPPGKREMVRAIKR